MSSRSFNDFCTFTAPKVHCSTRTSALNNWPKCIKVRHQERYFLFTITGHTAYHEAMSMHHHVMAAFCNFIPMHHLTMMIV